MRTGFLTILLSCGFTMMIHAGEGRYIVPEHSDKLLFYLQRTHNRNTVVYELNFKPDGKLDKKEPVHPMWIVYEEGGVRRELTFRQTWVYGINSHRVGKDSYVIHFRSYKKRDIYLVPTGKNNTYKALITINGKMAELTSLFICTANNALGIPTIVRYVDINGIDPVTGNVVNERINR